MAFAITKIGGGSGIQPLSIPPAPVPLLSRVSTKTLMLGAVGVLVIGIGAVIITRKKPGEAVANRRKRRKRKRAGTRRWSWMKPRRRGRRKYR
jgi:hypothetical protein